MLSFYTFINCHRPGCETVGDKISIKIKNGQGGAYEVVYTTGTDDGRLQELQWKRDDVLVQLNSSEVYVSSLFITLHEHFTKLL